MSGFFGVTSLGPSDPIAANLLSTLGITSFSDEEFEVAFKSLMDDQENINKIDVYSCVFHGVRSWKGSHCTWKDLRGRPWKRSISGPKLTDRILNS